MNSVRVKVFLALFLAILLPVIPSFFLVRGLIDRSLDYGLNDKFQTVLKGAVDISKTLYDKYKQETLSRIVEYVENHRQRFWTVLESRSETLPQPYPFEFCTVEIFNQNLERIYSDSSSQISPRYLIEQLRNKEEPGFVPGSANPRKISVFVPLWARDGQHGFIVVTRNLENSFGEAAEGVLEMHKIFKVSDLVRNELVQDLLWIFLLVYGSITALSLSAGYIFSRRFTRPLMALVKGTRVIAEGNWDYRVAVSSRDEVGQLVNAFNSMIVTIKEKQKIALEQEQEKRRIEVEHQKKLKDLEMSELRARALQAENDRKTLELEKAQELEKAYKALEESHRHLQEAQSQLVQSGKMASLGNLVAGVAHEINNPVGAIHSAADVCLRAVKLLDEKFDLAEKKNIKPGDHDPADLLDVIRQNTKLIVTASKRVVKIVKSLKTFARLDEAKYQRADIHKGLESTLELMQHELKNRIRVIKKYGDVPPIFCYSDELNQVFMNILANAAQAIEGHGTIDIRTYHDSTHVYIEISDSGKGISKEHFDKIFDPGFTTKGVGVGTGLGLAISYKILQKHNGDIHVQSEQGKGAKFTVILPLLPQVSK
ncbi:HAMP domain-containing protein [candidate division KSB1 bacterium]|nr:HAMP domain-containing protein [candidate division KSB1 bacterium]